MSTGGGVPGPGGVCSRGGVCCQGVCSRGGSALGGEGVGIPGCTEADPLWERRLLLRTVRILLECILVF